MKTIFLAILAVVGFSFFTTTAVQAEEQKPMQQTYDTPEAKIGDNVLCPVMKTPVEVTEKTLAVKIKDKNYYVCCAGCVKQLESDPDKYLKTPERKE